MSKKWKVISFGLGPIGASIARLAILRNDQIELVGAVDSNPVLVGKDLGSIVGLDRSTGITVRPTAEGLYERADIVLHATTSFLSTTKNQLIEFCQNGVDVVSTCEELAYPWFGHAEIAREIDYAARKEGVTLLGTGVNPGFVLDVLAITLSGICTGVTQIRATRILDATKRRLPFQSKVGVGLNLEQFEENLRTGKFGHIGLPESIAMTCAALNFSPERIEQRISAKIATVPVPTEHFGMIEAGHVLGLVQDAKAYFKERKIATYHIEMYAGAKDAHDEIELIGNPRISLRIPGGTPGDTATAAIMINSVPRVVEAAPGLLTVKDIRPASSVLM
ncbi:MAG: NAD(P)H-dependent amine dehydrogenase family protein [Nitrososphaerales archaeon]